MNSQKRRRRLGCALLIIPWLICMLLPCFVIALVMNQEVVITYSDVPEDALRIWVLDSAAARGIGISNSRRVTTDNNLTCTILDTRFLVWQGDAEKAGAKTVHRCACYERVGNVWQSKLIGAEACTAAGER